MSLPSALIQRVVRVILLGLSGAVLLPAAAAAQLYPDRFELHKVTCSQLLSYTGEERARLLIYFNGYQDGRSGSSVWDEKVVGGRVDRALGFCKATPSLSVLDAFARAWKP